MQTLDGRTLSAGFSNDLISYRDSGGLWRMGLEFWGGIWEKSVQASDRPTQVRVHERESDLEIACTTELNGETITRLMWLSSDSPMIRCRVEGRAAEGYSVIVRFDTGLLANKLTMGTPGGVVVRPLKRIYDPTFWPLHHFAHIQDADNGSGLAVLQAMPGAISFQPDGSLELVALRNATREKIFGFVGIPGNPATGHEWSNYALDYAILFTQSGDWDDNDIPSAAWSFVHNPYDNPDHARLNSLAASTITTKPSNVWVLAIKPAARGEGVIVRLFTPSLPESDVMVSAKYFTISEAFLCDARERDLGPLELRDGTVKLPMRGTITTIRLLIG
jgi:alpha-mannosidase